MINFRDIREEVLSAVRKEIAKRNGVSECFVGVGLGGMEDACGIVLNKFEVLSKYHTKANLSINYNSDTGTRIFESKTILYDKRTKEVKEITPTVYSKIIKYDTSLPPLPNQKDIMSAYLKNTLTREKASIILQRVLQNRPIDEARRKCFREANKRESLFREKKAEENALKHKTSRPVSRLAKKIDFPQETYSLAETLFLNEDEVFKL